jgi:hypothetical protein
MVFGGAEKKQMTLERMDCPGFESQQEAMLMSYYMIFKAATSNLTMAT